MNTVLDNPSDVFQIGKIFTVTINSFVYKDHSTGGSPPPTDKKSYKPLAYCDFVDTDGTVRSDSYLSSSTDIEWIASDYTEETYNFGPGNVGQVTFYTETLTFRVNAYIGPTAIFRLYTIYSENHYYEEEDDNPYSINDIKIKQDMQTSIRFSRPFIPKNFTWIPVTGLLYPGYWGLENLNAMVVGGGRYKNRLMAIGYDSNGIGTIYFGDI